MVFRNVARLSLAHVVVFLPLVLLAGKCTTQGDVSQASETASSMLGHRAFIPPGDFTFSSAAQSDLADPVAAMQRAADFFGTDPADEFLKPLIPSYRVFPALKTHDEPWERRIWLTRYRGSFSIMLRILQSQQYQIYAWEDRVQRETRWVSRCPCDAVEEQGDLIVCRLKTDSVTAKAMLAELQSPLVDHLQGDVFSGHDHLSDVLTVETATSSKMYVTRFDAWRRTDREAQSFKKIRAFLEELAGVGCPE